MSEFEVAVSLAVNGESFEARLPNSELLVDVIRNRMGLTGTNVGCDQGVCGACTVLVDGQPTTSCATFAWKADGRSVTTIEGVADDDPVVDAFVDATAFQCAYCTPGFVLATLALQAEGNALDRDEIVGGLAGNLCRCSSYVAIIEAATAATSE